jgi:hypothetical protein
MIFIQHRQCRVRRARIGRTPVEHADGSRFAQIGNIDDGETAMPVTDVQSIAAPDWMMAACVGAFEVRRFAAGDPLAGHPPAHDFFRLLGIFHVEHHGDVALIAIDRRRDVGVAAVVGETMHAFARRLVNGDLARFGAIGDVENLQSGLEFLFRLVALVVDQHDIATDAHFVRVQPFGDLYMRDDFGVLRILDIDDRRAVRRVHMADVGVAVLDDHRTAAG